MSVLKGLSFYSLGILCFSCDFHNYHLILTILHAQDFFFNQLMKLKPKSNIAHALRQDTAGEYEEFFNLKITIL